LEMRNSSGATGYRKLEKQMNFTASYFYQYEQ